MRRWLAVLLSSCSMLASAQPGNVQPGAVQAAPSMPTWTLSDQFDKPFVFNAQTEWILVARSMDTAKLVDAAMKERPKGYLEARHAIYIADIEKMPTVARMFAIPAMRSADYRILLDREGQVAPQYTDDRDTVALLHIKNGVLQQKRQFSDAEQLRSALESATP